MIKKEKLAYSAPSTVILALRIESRILENSLDPLVIAGFQEEEEGGELDAE